MASNYEDNDDDDKDHQDIQPEDRYENLWMDIDDQQETLSMLLDYVVPFCQFLTNKNDANERAKWLQQHASNPSSNPWFDNLEDWLLDDKWFESKEQLRQTFIYKPRNFLEVVYEFYQGSGYWVVSYTNKEDGIVAVETVRQKTVTNLLRNLNKKKSMLMSRSQPFPKRTMLTIMFAYFASIYLVLKKY